MSTELDRCLTLLIRNLVDHPEQVKVVPHVTTHIAQFEVHVHPNDFGKLLGKKGIYANSIRRVFSGAYGRHGKSFNLHIVDPRRTDTRRS